MQETGHMENKKHVKGNLAEFEFGNSKWITIPESLTVLRDAFQVPIAKDKPDEFLPVIFLGHALGNDFDHLNNC